MTLIKRFYSCALSSLPSKLNENILIKPTRPFVHFIVKKERESKRDIKRDKEMLSKQWKLNFRDLRFDEQTMTKRLLPFIKLTFLVDINLNKNIAKTGYGRGFEPLNL